MCRLFLWICLSLGMTFVPAISAFGQLVDPSQSDADQMELPDEPFLVFVAHDDAFLRCGPAGEHYRTDPLRHGQELEVYVSTDDGWLGVRPVEESFCWVHSEAIEVDPATVRSDREDRLGIVIEDKTVAWIGTNLGRARRYRWQVQLAEGEQVVIIGSAQRDGPDGPQTWFRIVPPSGEFRWIHQDQIAYTAEELLQSVKQAESATEEAEFLPSGPSSRSGDNMVARTRPRPRTISQLRGMEDDTSTVETPATDSIATDNGPKPITQRISEGIASLMQSSNNDNSDGLISRSSRRIAELIPIPNRPYNLTSPLALQTAPEPSGLSYLDQRVGSGLSPDADTVTRAEPTDVGSDPSPIDKANPVPGIGSSMLSTMEITSRPRMVTPGQLSAPNQSGLASRQEGLSTQQDGQLGPGTTAMTKLGLASVQQAAALQMPRAESLIAPNAVAPVQFIDRSPSLAPTRPTVRSIPQGVIDEIKRQASTADEQDLNVLFNKLVAKGASEPEVAVIASAAQSRNAMDLSARALEYMSLARRRDGQVTITPSPFGSTSQPPPSVPPTNASFATPPVLSQMDQNPTNAHIESKQSQPVKSFPEQPDALSPSVEPAAPTHSGVLVEVYSSDPNRPPFALTDEGGRTLAYVTPAPGIELRGMLGGRVEMSGETGFLRGVETPHILATAIRPWMRK